MMTVILTAGPFSFFTIKCCKFYKINMKFVSALSSKMSMNPLLPIIIYSKSSFNYEQKCH